MSDAIVISIVTTIGLVITTLINSKQNREIKTKVDNYHKEVNGKMTDLIETTKALGKAEGKAEEKEKNGA